MQGYIHIYIKDKHIEVHLFYRNIMHTDKQRKLELAADRLIKLPTFSEWTEVHNAVCDMIDMLREIKIFEVLLNPIDKNYIEQYSSFEPTQRKERNKSKVSFLQKMCEKN